MNSPTSCQVNVVVLNMISPCTLSAAFQEVVLATAGACIHENSDNIGILLSPMFSYKRGGVWQAESNVITRLVNKGLNLDRTFSLLFAAKCDPREARRQAKHMVASGQRLHVRCHVVAARR